MTREELTKLAERVEALTGADREVDCRAHLVANPTIKVMTDGGGYRRERPVEYTPAVELVDVWLGDWEGFATQIDAPAYTASLDAAMSLVPEVWSWAARSTGYARCIHPTQRCIDQESYAATPALALTAAALRARAEVLP